MTPTLKLVEITLDQDKWPHGVWLNGYGFNADYKAIEAVGCYAEEQDEAVGQRAIRQHLSCQYPAIHGEPRLFMATVVKEM